MAMNAMNTILSYITRQSTLNKLMASGVEVFEDAAQTKLRPALEIMTDVTDKWLDNAEQMPKELIDIADSMGLFEEELADVVGLQEEWTDLQKIEIEQGIAGVRRRQFLIALMRNFGQVQDVVNNLQEAEGYSMIQNIRTMQTLEKQVEQLRMEMTKLATALGDAGVLGQMKQIVGVGKDVAGFFAGLDSGLQTLILTLGEMTVLFSIVKAVAGMMGAKTVVAALASPYALPSFVGATAIAAYVLHTRQLREEQQQYVEVVSRVAQRQEQLNKVINNSVKGSASYNAAMDEKRELTKAITEQYPDLIAGYDTENEIIILNSHALQEANKQKEKGLIIDEQGLAVQDEKIQKNLDEIEAIQKQIEQNEQQAQQHDEDANRLRNLSKARDSLIREIEQEGIKAEELARKKQELENVDEAIIRISGRLSDTMKTTSDITVEAINAVIKVYKEQGEAARRAKTDMIKEEIEATQETIKLIQQRIRARQAEFQMEKMIAFRELESASAKLIGMGVIHDPHYYTSTDVSAYQQYADGLTRIEEETKRLQMDIKTLDELLSFQRKTLLDLENQLAKVAAAGSGGGGGGGGGGLGGETQKLSDIINKFIETALRAAEVQGMLNDEIQREMDGLQARINFYDKENATAWERNQVLQDEIRLRELAQQKYEGNHQQANLLREAVEKLRNRQQSLNVTVEEEWQEYKRLESQIESLLDSVSSLGIESFKLKGIINDNTRAIKEAEQAYKDAISTLDYFNRFGIYTAEQYLSEVNRIYSQQGALTLDQERDLYPRRYDAYKQMLNDMKREAEEAYRERIKLLEKETEAQVDNYKKRIELLEKETQATIDAIQRQIDALDEEAERENREEERRKHEEKLQELYDERRYHELRTGREHSQAILDIDKRIMEEKRRWELRQAEWTRQDKKAELQKEIEDVRDAAQQQREILERRIEDIQDAAKRQREVWEETYQRMQEDFSDHNINLLATAAAYDPDFWEDAKTKGELWVQGFKDGTAGFSAYLKSLLSKASGIIYGGGGGGYSVQDYSFGYKEGTMDLPGGGSVNLPGGTWTGSGTSVKDAGGWDNWERMIEQDLMSEGWKYDSSGTLQPPKSHGGSLISSAGIAELIPGELVFPPDLSIQMQRLISVLSAKPLSASQTQQQWRDGGNVEIRGNLLNIENANFGDETDIEIMSRELRRQVGLIRRR
jgi:hypothetical protein